MSRYVADIEGNEFYVRDLVSALKEEGLEAVIGQSGGGTATLYIELGRKCEDGSDYFLIGPGSYNWTDAPTSIMTTDELYYGEDGNYHMEPRMGEVKPGTSMADAAKEIAELFRQINTEEAGE